jgi:hypothetical protein
MWQKRAISPAAYAAGLRPIVCALGGWFMGKSVLVFIVIALIAGTAAQATPRTESFRVPKRGEVQLSVPEGWASDLSQPRGEVPPTISLKPKAGQPFEVVIRPFWRRGEDSTVYESALREQTEAEAAEAQSQAVESKLTVTEFSGTEGRGYYFTATDRSPKPGEYKYMAKGMLKLGTLTLAFIILTNDGQADVVADALQLLSTATHK